jgi:PIN domain nuclease of toxin-antitoxin system
MNLLLDTSIVLWIIEDSPRLPAKARTYIQEANAVFVSAVSIWEISIKASVRKINLDVDLVVSGMAAAGFQSLVINADHARAVRNLPFHHYDPFDRMLVAQALIEPLRLITSDRLLARYGDLVTVV